MRRFLLAVLVWLAVAVGTRGQSGFTQVSALVIDPSGNPYAGCTGNAAFVPSPSATTVPTIGGSTFQTTVSINQCDSFGAFTIVLADNNIVQDGHTSPPASQWRFNISSQDGKTSFFCVISISGITQNISTQIQACAPPLTGGGGGGGNKGSMYRFNIAGSTPLVASDFSFSGWGTGSTISSVTGTDTAFTVTMTAGTTPTINPTVTLTFHDGPWTNIYSVNAQTDNGSGNQTYIQEDHTLTSVSLTYLNLPQATKTYRITATVVGTTNIGNLASPLNAVVLNPQGTQTILGPNILNPQGPVIAGNINGVIAVDGIQYKTLQQAYSACPNSFGCTIDMRGNFSTAALTLGSFDPGTKAITILLGPYTYSVTQITVRTNLQVIGSGAGGAAIQTKLVQANGSLAPFVLGTGLSPANIATSVLLANFRLDGLASNSTDGISMVALASSDVTPKGGGLWYSALYNLTIGASVPFGRNQIRFDSTVQSAGGPSTDQFNSIRNVFAFRAKNGPPALLITGQYTGQLTIDDSEFDGQFNVLDTSPNIYNVQIDDGNVSPSNWLPYSISMNNVTMQFAWGIGSAAIYLNGMLSFNCNNCHFETDNGIIKEAISSTGGKGNWGAIISNSYIDGASGHNSGNGFMANLDGSSALSWNDTPVFGTPDAWCIGTCTYFSTRGTMNSSSGGLQPAPMNNRPVGGFDSDGPAMKHYRATTPSLTAGARTDVTGTWTTPFADGAYSVVCNIVDTGNAPTVAGLVLERQNANQLAGTFHVTIFNNSANTETGILDCIAVHD